jgi:hypothetical protein
MSSEYSSTPMPPAPSFGPVIPARMVEILGAEGEAAASAESNRDRRLEAMLDRLTSIEHRLANPRD